MLRIAFSSVVVCVLASCASGPETKPVTAEMAPAPEPVYVVGDKFVWQTEDGQKTHEIAAIEDGKLVWESSDGSTWITPVNFAMPTTKWLDASKGGFGEGEQAARQVRGSIFPLSVDNKMSMKVRGKSDDYPEGWDNTRDCSVKSQENIAVPAGEFDTYKIVCVTGKRTRTFFYSPDVGHFVYYRNYHTSKGGEPRILVSYERGKSWAGHQNKFEVALDNLKRAEVIAHIAGNTEAWTKGGGYYAPDGQLNVLWNGKESAGTWEVSDDGKVCYVVETWGPGKECHRYIREAGQTKLLYDGEARVAEIRPGNQLKSISN